VGLHVVDAENRRAALEGRDCCGDAGGEQVVGAGERAQRALARDADQDRPADRGERVESPDQLEVVLDRLAEADARIDQHALLGDALAHGELQALVGDTRIEVAYRSENARIDLNSAPKELLVGLFAHLGWSDVDAAAFADRIVAWRTPVQPNAANPEPDAYRKAGLDYLPRQAPFNSLRELGLVLGIPRDLPTRAAPYLTIYSGRAQINVEEADPLVLASLPGLSSEALSAALAARGKGAEDAQVISLLGAAGPSVAAEPGKTFRAGVQIWLRNRRVQAEIVFKLDSETPNPYEIMHWSDDFDGPQSLS